jgi:hypothetical protein
MKDLKHPATIIALLALFVALSGTAYASGMISGKQIVNRSIPEKKLTATAVKALQGERGQSFIKSGAPADNKNHLLASIDGLDVEYTCLSVGLATLSFLTHKSGDTGFVSGEVSYDTLVQPVQDPTNIGFQAAQLNLDVVAWSASVGKLARIDLGASANGSTCNVWGLIGG